MILVPAGEHWTLQARSNTDGAFNIQIPECTGPLLLTARRLGYAERRMVLNPADMASSPRLDSLRVELRARASRLTPLVMRGKRLSHHSERPEASATRAQELAATALNKPFDVSQFRELAQMVVGVNQVESSTGGPGLSINGQPASQTGVKLDGARFGGSGMPVEALNSIAVLTSEFDTSHGGFSGGELSATTRRGTEHWEGATSLTIAGPGLSFPRNAPGTSRHGPVAFPVSLGGGGPLIPPYLYAYGAVDAERTSEKSVHSLTEATSADLGAYGLSGDSLTRVRSVLRQLGVPLGTARALTTTTLNALGRLDVEVGTAGTLTLRGSHSAGTIDNLGMSPTSTPSLARNSTNTQRGLFAELQSTLAPNLSSIFRASLEQGKSLWEPLVPGPRGRLWLPGSEGDTLSPVSFAFGGGGRASSTRSHFAEVSEDITFTSANGLHEVRTGGLLDLDRATSESVAASGEFTYRSLADLAEGRPESYTGSDGSPQSRAKATTSALYVRDQMKIGNYTYLIFGLRGEHMEYEQSTAGDSLAGAAAASAGTHVPSETHISPRLGVSFSSPRVGIRAGVGEFVGIVPVLGLATANGFAGGNGAGPGDACADEDVIAPDWETVLTTRAISPSPCMSGVRTGMAEPQTLVGNGFRAPRIVHGSLGVDWGFGSQRVELYSSFDLGRVQTVASYRSLGNPAFVLPSEMDRPVYVPAELISSSTGLLPASAPVREVSSFGRSRTFIVSPSWNGVFQFSPRYHLLASVNYTYMHSRVLTTGVDALGGISSSTAGNPNTAEWQPSPLGGAHSLRVFLSTQLFNYWQVTIFGYAFSGQPYTPLVDQDINGDGSANDRGLISDPSRSGDSALMGGMQRLLQTASAGTRSCLLSQLGRVAQPGSCRTNAIFLASAQINFRVPHGDRLSVSLRATNLAAGLDYLVHGSVNLRGWGQYGIADPTLLNVRGFDLATHQFRYTVNPHFGTARGVLGQFAPARLQVRFRWTIGGDPAMQSLDEFISSGTGLSSAALREQLTQRILNVPTQVIGLNDSSHLHLSVQQIIALQEVADSLQPRIDLVIEQLTDALTSSSAGSKSTSQSLASALIKEAQELIERGAKAAQAALSRDQWDKLPDRLRKPVTEIPRTPTQSVRIGGGR
jgi:hypothetical protein